MISTICFFLIVATFFFRYYLLCQILETGFLIKKKLIYPFLILLCFFLYLQHSSPDLSTSVNISLLLILLFFAIFSSNTVTERLWKFGLIFIGSTALDGFFENLAYLIFPSFQETSPAMYFLMACLTPLVCLFLYWYKEKIELHIEDSDCHGQVLFILISIFIGATICMSASYLVIPSPDGTSLIADSNLRISCLCMLAASLLCIQVYYFVKLNRRLYAVSSSEKTLREAQEHYYKLMLDREEETKKFRHDCINHLMCMNALLSDGKLAELHAYMDDLQNTSYNFGQKNYFTGNTVLDAITNYYVDILPEKDIFYLSGNLQDNLAINSTDLSIIYSNLLKNAAEEIQSLAESGMEHLNIHVFLNFGKQFWQLEIRNTSNHSIKPNTIPKTNKKDTRQHGIGLQNVKSACIRNGGTLQLRSENHMFIATVVLPL